MGSCVLIPSVKSKYSGHTKPSPLFNSLLSNTSERGVAVDLYEKFLGKKLQKHFKEDLNEYGEVEFDTFLQKTNAGNYLDYDKVTFQVAKSIDELEGGEVKIHSIREEPGISKLLKKANAHNTKRGNTILADIEFENPVEYKVKALNAKSIDSNKRIAELNSTEKLMTSLEEITTKHGFSTSYITETEKKMGVRGEVTFDVAEKSALNLVGLIRVSKGDMASFTEEHAHAILELLGDHPLVNRLKGHLESNDLYKAILGEEYALYEDAYFGNVDLLVKEAMGKLVAQSLLEQGGVPIAERIFNVSMEMLSGIEESDLLQAIDDASNLSATLAKGIITRAFDDAMSRENISLKSSMYRLQSEIDKLENAYDKISETLVKRDKMEQNLGLLSDIDGVTSSEEMMIDLSVSRSTASYDMGLLKLMRDSTSSLEAIIEFVNDTTYSELPMYKKCSIIRNLDTIILSGERILDEYDILSTDGLLADGVDSATNKYREILGRAKVIKKALALRLSEHMLIPFVEDPDNILVKKGEKASLRTILERLPFELGFTDTYLRSMAQSSDPVLRIIDRMVRSYTKKTYQQSNEFRKKVLALGEKYKQKGLTDYTFMRRKDKEGNPTMEYVHQFDEDAFNDAYYSIITDKTIPFKTRVANAKAWVHENSEMETRVSDDGNTYTVYTPKKGGAFELEEYKRLTPLQREFLDEFLKLKSEVDSNLPLYAIGNGFNAIAVRKDKMERLKSNGLKDSLKSFADILKITSDDIDSMNALNKFVGFDGRMVVGVPLYFHKMTSNDTVSDMSTDEISNLISYGAMSFQFANNREAANLVEIQRLAMKNRKYENRDYGRKITEVIESKTGIVTNTAYSQANLSIERLEKYMDNVLYGTGQKLQTVNIGNKTVNVGKAARALGSFDGFIRMSFNILGAIVNRENGKMQVRMEAFANSLSKAGDFDHKSYFRANTLYKKEVIGVISELNNPIKKSKLGLVSELMDISQGEMGNFNGTDFNKKFYEKFNMRHLSFLQSSGEHEIAHVTAMSMMMSYKLKEKNGKETNLWDALIPVPIDPKNTSLGYKLKIKDGVTKLDGTEFDLSVNSKDILSTSEKIAETNRYLQGIYNKQDMNTLNMTALGSLMLMYRKWMVPAYNKRFGSTIYNYNLEREVEGSYRTLASFALNVSKEITKGKFALLSEYEKLSDSQRQGIWRSLIELSVMLAMWGLIHLLWGGKKGDDDKDKMWISALSEYVLRRMTLDMQFFTPGPWMMDSIRKTLSSPMVALGTLDGFNTMLSLIWNTVTWQLFDEVEKGRYKGHTVLYKNLVNIGPFSIAKSIDNFIHPENLIPYTKNDL